MKECFISSSEARHRAGNPSRTTLWRWGREGNFPKPRKIGPNRIGYLESEVEKWVETRPYANRSMSGDK